MVSLGGPETYQTYRGIILNLPNVLLRPAQLYKGRWPTTLFREDLTMAVPPDTSEEAQKARRLTVAINWVRIAVLLTCLILHQFTK
jgi:hypothetical protein